MLSLEDIESAQLAMTGVVHRTPLLVNSDVDERLGTKLLIKCENLQRTNAFKIRGAFNCLRLLSHEERARGVISYSSGNHALGLARAAALFDTSALIVMPDDAPQPKVDAVRAMGASITFYQRRTQNYEVVVEELIEESGRTHVPPSADSRVLAGAGVVALEILEQAAEIRADLTDILIPCGGGGLTAATATVMNARSKHTRVYAVEPEGFDDTYRSLRLGRRVANEPGKSTICDSIMTPKPNELTFGINAELLSGGLVVSDDDVRNALSFLFENYKVIAEPGGAVGIAAILNGAIDVTGKSIATVLTGGNIDPASFFRLLKL